MPKRPVALVFDPLSWKTSRSHDIERKILAGRGVELIVPDSPEERDRLMPEATVLVSAGLEAVSESDIASLSSCVGIVAALAGIDHIDTRAADRAGLVVRNVTVSTEEVADHAMALVLAATRHLPQYQAAVDRRDWRYLDLPGELGVRRLRGQVMGIVGPGRIGRAVAERAAAFGFEIVAAGRQPDGPGPRRVDLNELWSESDVIVVCAAATEETHHLIDRAAFSRMKRGVVLVNVARGSLIDESALVEALDSGIVRTAALDVRESEPPPSPDPLAGRPDVISTPHIGGASKEASRALREGTAAQVIDVLESTGHLERTAEPDDTVAGFHHLDEMEAVARTRLSANTYNYVAGGAGDESTIRHNRESLDRLRLLPRVMRNMNDVSLETTALGTKLAFPLLAAPSAVQRLAHPDGEIATARAVRDAGLAMVLSMNASTPVEEVAATGVDFMMQLYLSRDREHDRGIIERAEAAGARALVLTVDHAGMPVRLRELADPLVLPPEVKFAHLSEKRDTRGPDRDLTWDDIGWLRGISTIPVVVKGVLHPDDARLAVESGVDGVIVSNHGGRQLEGVVSSYEMLQSVLEAVDGRVDVLVDGGIRSGADLLKALALGARAALVGRPIWWGLAAAGEKGVSRVFEILRRDLDAAVRLCGVTDIGSVGPHLLKST